MRSLVVIPARLGATRLPRKPLRLLGGLPLIVRVWERVSSLDVGDRVVIATDSPDVADAVLGSGAECVLTSDEHPSGTDRVAEVAARPEFAEYDVVINVQGDEPFVLEDAVRGAADMVQSGHFPLGTAAARIPHEARAWTLETPSVVKVVHADDGRALYFSRSAIPHLRDAKNDEDRADHERLTRQHIGVYAYTRDALATWVSLPTHPLERVERLEQLRPLAAGMAMGVALVDEAPAPGIDTEEDLLRANERWSHYSGRM